MNPKQKAIELIEFYRQYVHGETKQAKKYASKQCALKAIDEILQTNPTIKGNSEDLLTMIVQTKAYYIRVIQEVNKL